MSSCKSGQLKNQEDILYGWTIIDDYGLPVIYFIKAQIPQPLNILPDDNPQ
jgi:hypothetical protein